MLYTSQSATSTYQRCNLKRYFQNHYLGHGIVSTSRSIPLTTGSCVHTAIQYLATSYLESGKDQITDVDGAVAVAVAQYKEIVNAKHPLAGIKDEQQQITLREQIALTEVLVRLWAMMEWPVLVKHYHIFAVEQEILYPVAQGVMYQAKPDLILLDKKTNAVTCYSLKTTKAINDWAENSYYVNNQIHTEPYFTQLWLQDNKMVAEEILGKLSLLPEIGYLGRKVAAIKSFFEKIGEIPDRVSQVRFCYIVKGERRETERGSKVYYTDNPFLYGYRKFSANQVEYAWTNNIVKAENKSGYGRLGKGWESFSTFEGEKGQVGVKAWMQLLFDGKIANDIGDGKGSVFNQYILSQPDINVNQGMMEMRVGQLFMLEEDIREGLDYINEVKEKLVDVVGSSASEYHLFTKDTDTLNTAVLANFPMNTNSCFYPTQCEYLTICPNGNKWFRQFVADDPLNEEYGPLYEIRVPHHETERVQIEKKKGQEENGTGSESGSTESEVIAYNEADTEVEAN